MERLPIEAVLPAIVDGARRARRVVVRAEPGAGKTTRVPPALLDAGLAGGDRTVVVVEPRRIAARAAAAWIAAARGEAVGETVGYRVRFETRGGAATRLWFVTEGVFARQLAGDPLLDRAGVVVLDEFHERHLDGDLALAVVRYLQDTVRPDLVLAVMSATLDAPALAAALPGAVVVDAPGRAHPVEIAFRAPPGPRTDVADRVAGALPEALDGGAGDVLVFLAGARDIRRTAARIAPLAAARGVGVAVLHGMQPLDEQQRVLRAGPRRRVVLATNVAETALTVEGVTTVIDTGEARVARFDPRRGVNRLDVVPISRAAAAQRAGRAGRQGPGRCLRLWSAAEDAGRRARETPEILRLDLARLVLAVRAWGMAPLADLAWLDPPPPASLARAEALLADVGALRDGALTPLGRRLLDLPLEPRLARVLLEADRLGAAAEGALLVAIASERDVLRRAPAASGRGAPDFPSGPSDLALRVTLLRDWVRSGRTTERARALGLDAGAARAVLRVWRRLAPRGGLDEDAPADRLGRAVLAGFPDRVARRRADGGPRAVMVGGTGVVLAAESVVREAPLFVCVEVEAGRGGEGVVRLASAVEPEWLADLPAGLTEEVALEWDATRERAVERRRRRYRDLVLDERTSAPADRAAASALVAAAALADPVGAGLVDAEVARLLARLAFWRRTFDAAGALPRPETLLAGAIEAAASGLTGLPALRRAGVAAALRRLVPPAVRGRLEREAPEAWTLPSGRRAPITYAADRPPRVAARIQECFGLAHTPRLGGRVPLVIELLAPNGRPVQVTDDLRSFWETTYADVRRQLRGRYPKHDWPEDPATARPSAGPKRRR